MNTRNRGWSGRALVGMMVAGVCTLATLPGLAANVCDRSCLDGYLVRYLEAVFRHDPASAPLATTHRATFNGAPMAAGEGAWRTQTGLGRVQRHFIDPQTGGAAYFGELMAGTQVQIASVRIKVAQGSITEAEWTTGTSPNSHWYEPEGLEHYPPPMVIPLGAAERVPRAQLIATADAYFQGLNDHDGARIPAIRGCDRIENGARTTHRPKPSPNGGPELETGDCTSGFEIFRKSIVNLQPRRFPLVDEESGVVMGTTILHRPPGNTEKRNLLTEYFFIRAGKIADIYTAMYYLDTDAPDSSGW